MTAYTADAIRLSTADERRQLVQLALGRIFRLGSRPTQPGDVEQYGDARSIILECADADGMTYRDDAPNYARDRMRGAQGD